MLCYICLITGVLPHADQAVTMVRGTAVCQEHIWSIKTDGLFEEEE